jgi:hypothetical protein
MQPESGFASSLSEDVGIEDERATASFQAQNFTVTKITSNADSKPRESRLDPVSSAVFVGMTAQFVVFLIGLVTDIVPRLIENIILSVFAGLCVFVIALALMKKTDKGSWW